MIIKEGFQATAVLGLAIFLAAPEAQAFGSVSRLIRKGIQIFTSAEEEHRLAIELAHELPGSKVFDLDALGTRLARLREHRLGHPSGPDAEKIGVFLKSLHSDDYTEEQRAAAARVVGKVVSGRLREVRAAHQARVDEGVEAFLRGLFSLMESGKIPLKETVAILKEAVEAIARLGDDYAKERFVQLALKYFFEELRPERFTRFNEIKSQFFADIVENFGVHPSTEFFVDQFDPDGTLGIAEYVDLSVWFGKIGFRIDRRFETSSNLRLSKRFIIDLAGYDYIEPSTQLAAIRAIARLKPESDLARTQKSELFAEFAEHFDLTRVVDEDELRAALPIMQVIEVAIEQGESVSALSMAADFIRSLQSFPEAFDKAEELSGFVSTVVRSSEGQSLEPGLHGLSKVYQAFKMHGTVHFEDQFLLAREQARESLRSILHQDPTYLEALDHYLGKGTEPSVLAEEVRDRLVYRKGYHEELAEDLKQVIGELIDGAETP